MLRKSPIVETIPQPLTDKKELRCGFYVIFIASYNNFHRMFAIIDQLILKVLQIIICRITIASESNNNAETSSFLTRLKYGKILCCTLQSCTLPLFKLCFDNDHVLFFYLSENFYVWRQMQSITCLCSYQQHQAVKLFYHSLSVAAQC